MTAYSGFIIPVYKDNENCPTIFYDELLKDNIYHERVVIPIDLVPSSYLESEEEKIECDPRNFYYIE